MRRAVITGLGIVSSIGINQEQVTASLKAGKSGITFSEEFAEMGMRSQVWGNVDIDFSEHIDRKVMRFMGDAAAYAYVAMKQAIDDSGLTEEQVSNIRTGIVAGSGGGSSKKPGRLSRRDPRKRREACRPLYGTALHGLNRFGMSGHAI